MSFAVDGSGQFQFGVSSEPLRRLNFHEADLSDVSSWWGRPQTARLGKLVRRWRLKQWHYVCVKHSEIFLAVAVAHLGYVGNVFVYLVDSQRKYEMERIVPLGLGIRVGASSREKTTCRGIAIDFRDVWSCRIDIALEGKPLRLDLELEPAEALALLHPLHRNRAAYTHKEVGNRCRGTVEWQGRTLDLAGSLGGIDYTCSYADRHTRWHWVFLMGHTSDGRRFGFNGAQHLYGEAENYVWLDDARYPVGKLQFTISARGAWAIEGPSVSLLFNPTGRREQNVNYGIVRSQFVQPYGQATGTVTLDDQIIALGDVFGVCEQHDALW